MQDFWNNGFQWLISHLSRTLITLYRGEKKIELIQSKYPKYDFNYYVLTSPYAFSAGNIFPQMVKDNNVGKVIGYKTFGGASAISYAILPTGDIIQLSKQHCFYR
nr:S41 family peptidase [Mycoplasmopsis bovis]